MNNDYIVLRELGKKYIEIASSDRNYDNIVQHRKVNDLQTKSPIILVDEIPWGEMNIDGELTLHCIDPEFRAMEEHLRKSIYKWEHMSTHMVLPPYLSVRKVVNSTGIGMDTMYEDESEYSKVSTHHFVDQLQTEEDLEKLKLEKITYDEESTKKKFDVMADIFSDIVPVRISGIPTGYNLGCKNWDDIVFFRGLDTLLFDLIERPEFMHKIVKKLTDIFVDKVKQYEELGIFDTDMYSLHCASALNNTLKPDKEKPKAKDMWGRGLAQIFSTVSPEMHDEFDIQYMVKAMEMFGMVYYGCCEPLDKKIHILEQIKNLRKISITPWADISVAAEAIGEKYVVSVKPNPASLSTSSLDEYAVKKELSTLISSCVKNGCSFELVLKDITTVGGNVENLFKWTNIAMDMVNSI